MRRVCIYSRRVHGVFSCHDGLEKLISCGLIGSGSVRRLKFSTLSPSGVQEMMGFVSNLKQSWLKSNASPSKDDIIKIENLITQHGSSLSMKNILEMIQVLCLSPTKISSPVLENISGLFMGKSDVYDASDLSVFVSFFAFAGVSDTQLWRLVVRQSRALSISSDKLIRMIENVSKSRNFPNNSCQTAVFRELEPLLIENIPTWSDDYQFLEISKVLLSPDCRLPSQNQKEISIAILNQFSKLIPKLKINTLENCLRVFKRTGIKLDSNISSIFNSRLTQNFNFWKQPRSNVASFITCVSLFSQVGKVSPETLLFTLKKSWLLSRSLRQLDVSHFVVEISASYLSDVVKFLLSNNFSSDSVVKKQSRYQYDFFRDVLSNRSFIEAVNLNNFVAGGYHLICHNSELHEYISNTRVLNAESFLMNLSKFKDRLKDLSISSLFMLATIICSVQKSSFKPPLSLSDVLQWISSRIASSLSSSIDEPLTDIINQISILVDNLPPSYPKRRVLGELFLFKLFSDHVPFLTVDDAEKIIDILFVYSGQHAHQFSNILGDFIADNIEVYPSEDLVSFCRLFAEYTFRNERFYFKVADKFCTSGILDEFDFSKMATVSWSFAEIGLRHSKLFAKLFEKFLETDENSNFSLVNLVYFVWGLSLNGFSPIEHLWKLIPESRITDFEALKSIEKVHLYQVIAKQMAIEKVDCFTKLSCAPPAHLTPLIHTCKESFWISKSGPIGMAVMEDMGEILEEVVARDYPDYFVQQDYFDMSATAGYSLKFALIPKSDQNFPLISLELLRPSMMATARTSPLGWSLLKKQTLSHLGWNVVDISLSKWNSLRLTREKENFLSLCLSSVSHRSSIHELTRLVDGSLANSDLSNLMTGSK